MSTLTKEQFQKDVADHRMQIIRDDGVYRHVRFQQPGSSDMYFDLITWPGCLCYTGDMGTYVFQRTTDMFEFFRRPAHCRYTIDVRYWAEKVEAGDKSSRGDGIKEFSKAKFDANVRKELEDFIKREMEEAAEHGETELCTCAMSDLRAEVENDVISADDNDIRCYDAANDFKFDGSNSDAWVALYGDARSFDFTDFWEVDHTEYTLRFQWCCMALSWAMQVYDEAKAGAPAESTEVPA